MTTSRADEPETDRGQAAGAVLLRLLALCWRHRMRCLLVLLLQLALLSTGLVGLSFTGVGIDYLNAALNPSAPPVRWPLGLALPEAWEPMTTVGAIAGIVVVAALIRGALTWAAGVSLAELVHRRVVAELQTAVFAKLQHLGFAFFDRQSSGSIINRATGDIQAIRTFVDTVLIQTLVTVISLAVYAGYMISINASLTLACIATLPALWIACVVFSRLVHPEYVRNRALFDRMILTLAECVQGMNVIKGFAREREMAGRFESDNRAVKDQQQRIFWRVSTFSPVIDFLTQINLVVLLIYGGKLVIDGTLPLGAGLVVFAGLLQQFSNQVSTTAQIANGVQESLTGARRVFEILDAPFGVQSPPDPLRPAALRGAVCFESVSFGYEPGNPVLQDVNIAVAPGECIAVVGETGSGKSALLSLIPRFYDPEHGRVTVDGHDVRALDVQWLRRRVSVVFQESFLFSDTVAANICFGRADARIEDAVAAAKAARAHEFIEALPQGYDTVLGESGVDLSGGQRQRLAIARALLNDPSILLLDDPTAAIDPETEHEILGAIEQAIAGRTTFIVAHRLSTLRRADRILVLERGRIVQSGTHAELVRVSGTYRRAALHQMIDEESRRLLLEESIDPPRDPASAGGAGGRSFDRGGGVEPMSLMAAAGLPHNRDLASGERPTEASLNWRVMRRVLAFTRPHARKRNTIFVLTGLRAIQKPALAWALAAVINGPITNGEYSGVIWGATVFLVLAFFTELTFHFRQRLALEFGEAVVHDLRNAVFHHLQRMPMSYFNKTKLGRILGRMITDIEAVRRGVQNVFFFSLLLFGQMAGAAALMLYYNWVLFLVLLAVGPLVWFVNKHFHPRLSSHSRAVAESQSRITGSLAESVKGMRVIQGYTRQQQGDEAFGRLVDRHASNNLNLANESALYVPLLDLNSQLFLASLLVVGGYGALNGVAGMEIGSLIAFFFLPNLFFQSLQHLANLYTHAITSMAGAERVFQLLDLEPEWEDAPDARLLPDPRGKGATTGARVEFRNVSFAYEPGRTVLHDISFVAEPGQMVALVGHTGSGKSSIINLVAKFHLPEVGGVFVDGYEIRSLRGDSLRGQMGIVLQTNFLFTGTVMDNIRLGRPAATDDDVRTAARGLDCLDLLESLPRGLETEVGERGAGLSLGQRQLICFTRAMLANPRILILDEATSAVDTITESRLQRALERLMKGRTCFVVAHRLSTIRKADVILVLEEGRIRERGDHLSLLARPGHYRDLYRQFALADPA